MLGMADGLFAAHYGNKSNPVRTSKNSSTDSAPLVPPLKLSMKRIHRRSRGTVVPPDVTQTIGRPAKFPSGLCLRINASTGCWIELVGAGASAKKSSTV